MPPKKKGSGKKGKGKKKGGKKQVPPSAAPKVDDETKEFFLVQIRDLENRVARYQKRCDELEVANGQFLEKFDQLSSDKKEIVAFWKKQLDLKTEELADLNDKHIGLQQARDNEREAFKKQIQEQRTEYQEMKDSLTAENMILGGKLASLEEFKVQKEELMNKFAEMENELLRKEEENQDHLYMLEKKAVIDKDRLKKEMILRVNHVAAEFRKVSNKQMAETTKRTIRENVSITTQLAKMSDKTIELIQQNDELGEKVKSLKQQVELMESNEKELSKRNQSNLKVIKLMTEKCQSQESLISQFAKRDDEFMELQNEAELLHKQIFSTRNELEAMTRDNTEHEQLAQQLKEMLQKETKLRTQIQGVLAAAAAAIRDALVEIESDAMPDEMQQINSIYKRDHMLENLLVLLDSAANLGIGPKHNELGKQISDHKFQAGSNLPGARQGIQKGDFPDVQGTLPHYQLGDLGLIPRPNQHVPTNMDKMKVISKIAKLGALRGVLSKSVATQTVSAPNALIFASQLTKKLPTTEVLKELRASFQAQGVAPNPVPKRLIENV
ncbi:unnamed protein product [Lymnaea stagnalis]|uniref:Cilia- and flagella-associated protein 157 n=1 Tax=Lymnaea stagnalis TaxID=6523 RepID=A0AAV2HC90_LYMST